VASQLLVLQEVRSGFNQQSVNIICHYLTRWLEVHTASKKNMKSNQTRSVRGFTLVEIMIVVAIIALLAAIAIPNLLKAGAKTQATTCINNLRQIDTAVQQFAIEARKHVGDTITYPNDISVYIKLNSQGQLPPCPTGGIYSLTTVGTVPSALCSLGTTVNPPHIQQ
jgi:prepilin-type N-terminal cleavage/methylation domain-containing protein